MKKALMILGVLVVLFVIGALYFGAAHTVSVREEEIGPFILVYESNKGDYTQTGDSVKKLMDFAKQKSVEPKAGFGMYLDDPNKVPKEELRSEAGIVVEEEDLAALQLDASDFKHRQYPRVKAVVSDFPLKGFPSVLLGIWRVYPAIIEYMETQGYSPAHSFEIYEIEDERTIYAFPLQVEP